MSNLNDRLNQLAAGNYADVTARRTSNRYRAIDTAALVQQVVEAIGLNASIDSVSTRLGAKSTKHAVVLTLSTPILLAGTACFPRIYVRNSYAGESALTVRVGFYRLICSNGMMVGTTHFGASIRHVQSGIDKLPALTAGIQDAVAYITAELPKLADRLNRIRLTASETAVILANIGASQRLVDRIMPSVTQTRYVRPEDKQSDGSLTAWNVWNIINEHSRIGARSPLRTLDRDAKLFEAIDAVASQAAA